MSTPKKGSARWVEHKLHEIAETVEGGTLKAADGKALAEIYREAYAMRMARAQQIRAGEDVETYIEQEENGQLAQPELRLIENG